MIWKITDFSQLKICRPYPRLVLLPFLWWCAQCWIEWKINFTIFIFQVIADFIYNLRVTHRDFQVGFLGFSTKKKVVQSQSNLQKRCAFLRFFIFWVTVAFVRKIHRKIDKKWPYLKNAKIGKLIFYSFQHIPHLLRKYEHIWIFFNTNGGKKIVTPHRGCPPGPRMLLDWET